MPVSPKATVVPFTISATGRGVGQTVTVGGGNAHTFTVDTHPAFGGSDASPSPLSYTLGALSSCTQITANIVAGEMGVRLGGWTFEVVGDLDTAVMVLGQPGNATFDRVTVAAAVETDATDEQFDRLRAEAERRCPVTQLVAGGVTTFTTTWARLPLPG